MNEGFFDFLLLFIVYTILITITALVAEIMSEPAFYLILMIAALLALITSVLLNERR